ncbi:hypothetical protein F4824DRAFT_443125 [Ustulina deusta]|nr:hypothetical protein F4823DRAFT_584454 [Ustulina deusta]KAI3342745.1 hypothetical protein F4824DRAFT_443125 [Ustulina deusta]
MWLAYYLGCLVWLSGASVSSYKHRLRGRSRTTALSSLFGLCGLVWYGFLGYGSSHAKQLGILDMQAHDG